MTGISTLDQLRTTLRGQGVRTAYVKHLSAKQDNSKNQIYLGTGLDGVTNLFPAQMSSRSASESSAKRKSAVGQPKLEGRLDFAWVSANGHRQDAPNTRIIDYFQYPEVRLSGFLKGVPDGPRSLVRDDQGRFGKRILVMGTASDGKVLGIVLTELEDPLTLDFPDLPFAQAGGVLRVLTIDGDVSRSPEDQLRDEISAIIRGGWHSSRINRGGIIAPFTGSQGGGYTLEALLGVAANGNKAPDRHGFEIKGFSGSRISLMTPTPDGGYQGQHSFREFMERWGYAGQKGDGSRRFTGLHKCGSVNEKTRLCMRVAGYDRASDQFGDVADVAVELVHNDTGEIAASWSLDKLANCWNLKHASALYIGFVKQAGENGTDEYRYGPTALIGRGTDVWRLLRAIDSGLIFYDPADTIYAIGQAKVRSQWRINARDLPAAMSVLYAGSEMVTL
ncbi:MvaI/BcnI family restriction endonuclease [Sphingomonas sp. LY54]|uniref:MvaI/BcnI family restriction endonuclease n=1 Tax=Sphingomonas sp. LY54 TaxID=3095343 RepID=UPI002D78E888|nr:MvaI/BcnI family restriction endonuclease [Sphingomonas sp. LY54]WRP29781.1 MvaI/BcnI family restriction endonuclease [Sphingomonas sp. LY54]